ncbi:hypothetical protein AgCh_028727 [Apium graveolens]
MGKSWSKYRRSKLLRSRHEMALSSISNLLVSSPSPFYNLKYVKLPNGFEASLSSIVRSYLLGGSPTATIVSTVPQNIVPHATTASMTARNVVIEDTLDAPTKLVDSNDIQKMCIDTVGVGVQEKLVLQNTKIQANRGMPVGAPVEGTCDGQEHGNSKASRKKDTEVIISGENFDTFTENSVKGKEVSMKSEDALVGKKKSMLGLSLDYEWVISALAEKNMTWRPELDLNDCWPDCRDDRDSSEGVIEVGKEPGDENTKEE